MEISRIKFNVNVTKSDCIHFGYHAFWNRRGMARNIIVITFVLFLAIQSIREVLLKSDSYLYIYLLLILIIASPLSIYTSYKGFFKRNYRFSSVQTFTIDKNSVRIKKKNSSEKLALSNMKKITQNKKAIYLWWENEFNASIIPKRDITEEESKFILSLINQT